MRDAELMYTGTFEETGVSGLTTRKSIKKCLQEKIPNLEVTSSPSVNEPDMIHLSGVRSTALQAVVAEQSEDIEEHY